MDMRWLLLARYRGQPFIPAEQVCADYFQPLTFKAWKEQVAEGRIPLPLTRMTESKKSPLYVSLDHLARFLEDRAEAAAREQRALAS